MDKRILEEKPHDGSILFGPACSYCGSRRTERVIGMVRECKCCGLRGEVRVTPRGCFVEGER